MPEFCYITFPTTYYALKAESVTKKADYKIKMGAVPRSISTSCGTALRCLPSDAEAITELLRLNKVEVEGVYQV